MKAAGYARLDLLFTCGNGETGKLGLGGIFSTTIFTACKCLPDVDVRAVSCGNAHTAVVTECGTVFTCGSNDQFQLGHSNDLKELAEPLEVDISERIVSVSAGGAFTLAITDSGALYGAQLHFWVQGVSKHDQSMLSWFRFRVCVCSHRAVRHYAAGSSITELFAECSHTWGGSVCPL
jgi:Regulator of chromosome condensation (RCC1) repeat